MDSSDGNDNFNIGVAKVLNPETGEYETPEEEQLSNVELIKRAEDFTEALQLEKAVSLYDEGLTRFPNDTIILDNYTDLLLQLGEP